MPPPAAGAGPLEGVDEGTWLDVIHKMDEVYSQLVHDEIALEEKNAELERSQQFIISLLSAMSDVLLACNAAGEIEQTNQALRELVGRREAELQGQPVQALLADPADGERLLEALGGATQERVLEVCLRDAAGRPVPVDFNCSPRRDAQGRVAGHVFVGRPMAEIKRAYRALQEAHEALKRTQQQLLHSEKMASLGRLVAGVAHELNNPISFVLGNVHALQRYTERLQRYIEATREGLPREALDELARRLRIDYTLGDLPSLLEGTLEGAQRTADIVDGLKRFSAVDRAERQPVDLVGVIERALHWVRKGTAPEFDVQFQHDGPAWVSGSAGQLMQVMMNLVQNAYDAAAGCGDRKPRLQLRLTQYDATVHLEVQDNGPGIAAEHLDHVFEPFFTTKPVGKGTGLGLSISYGLVEQHGGRLRAGNGPVGGALFELWLPRLATPPAAA
ncbi:MAG: PAS domain-containing sensor histidine kinase [Roseateles depolymerans]|uniref:histidine kinase n=1 Tax=Roseateles depolymerans TaxID=76731 RepID=A0A2W5DP78_9BURK|nr:MAG: PAS domain-containing sensor histidine kinase [Roseateles depolymerans]